MPATPSLTLPTPTSNAIPSSNNPASNSLTTTSNPASSSSSSSAFTYMRPFKKLTPIKPRRQTEKLFVDEMRCLQVDAVDGYKSASGNKITSNGNSNSNSSGREIPASSYMSMSADVMKPSRHEVSNDEKSRTKDKKVMHLRPRSMTDRVASFLDDAKLQGHRDRIKRERERERNSGMGSLEEGEDDYSDDDEDYENDNDHESTESTEAAAKREKKEEWLNLTTYTNRRKQVHDDITYYCLSEKTEVLNMRSAEDAQRASGDSFWGMEKYEGIKFEETRVMKLEDERCRVLRDLVLQEELRCSWRDMEREESLRVQGEVDLVEERRREEYMKVFYACKDSGEVVAFKWGMKSKSWGGRKGQRKNHNNNNNYNDDDNLNDLEVTNLDLDLDFDTPQTSPKLAQGTGYILDVLPFHSPAKTRRTHTSPSPSPSFNTFKSTIPPGPSSSSSAAAYKNRASIAHVSQILHPSGSKRGNKIAIVQGRKGEYFQEPFERFGCKRVRARKDDATGEIDSQSKGMFLRRGESFSGDFNATVTSAGANRTVLPETSKMPSFKDRIPHSTYAPSTPSIPTTLHAQQNQNLSLTSSSSLLPSHSKSDMNLHTANARERQSMLRRTQSSSSNANLNGNGNSGGGTRVDLGLFKGLTIPKGGTKRRSVLNPVLPKTEVQSEREHLKCAFNVLLDVCKGGFSGSSDSSSGGSGSDGRYVSVNDVIKCMKDDGDFRYMLRGTIVWPVIKQHGWDNLRAFMLEKRTTPVGRSESESQGTDLLNFEDFYAFSRALYVESDVSISCVRRLGSKGASEGSSNSRVSVMDLEVGERVEVRCRGGPFWFPAAIRDIVSTSASASASIGGEGGGKATPPRHSFTVELDIVSAYTLVMGRGLGVGDGVDIFSSSPPPYTSQPSALQGHSGGDESGGSGSSTLKKQEDAVNDERNVFISTFNVIDEAVNSTANPELKGWVKKSDIITYLSDAIHFKEETKVVNGVYDTREQSFPYYDSNGVLLHQHSSEAQPKIIAKVGPKVGLLRALIAKSAALVAIVTLDDINAAFLSLKERRNEDIEEGHELSGVNTEMLSLMSFVEVGCKIGEIIRFNDIQVQVV